MKKLIILICLFFSQSIFATIWITYADPQSNKIGVVGASSGNIGDKGTMVLVDNHGIATIGSWYLTNKQHKTLKKRIAQNNLSATAAVEEFSEIINRDSYKRRVSLVNAHFENASRPGRGCHQDNHYCGFIEQPQFTVTGGGLVSENVLLAAKEALLDPAIQHLPIECKLYKGIEAIIKSGGELKIIKRLAFAVDDLAKNKDLKSHLYHNKGLESSLLKQFENHLKANSIKCL